MDKTKLFTLIAIITIISACFGLTYAFFTANTDNTNSQKVSIKNGTMLLTFSDGDNGVSANLAPGNSVTKKFTLENTGTLKACGRINWTKLVNTYMDGTLTWKLQESDIQDGTYKDVTSGNVPSKDGELVDGLCLKPGVTHYYNLVITLNDLKDVDQTKDANAKFSSYFNMVEGTFPPTGAEQIEALVKDAPKTSTSVIGTTSLAYDGTDDSNLRYVGKSPNNYVKFNDETWRIIGVFNNIDDGTGKKEKRIKIIRNDSIGNITWDSSDYNTNNGYGINDWSQADLMTELNSGPYWNRTSGLCYNGAYNGTITCDFSTTGLTDSSKEMIDNAVWYLGGLSSDEDRFVTTAYNLERGTKVPEGHSTVWSGKVGLMYPSDYGYATTGGNTLDREKCINSSMNTWGDSGYSDCKNNDWLLHGYGFEWMITSDYQNIMNVFRLGNAGNVWSNYANSTGRAVRPTVYLKSDVSIDSGTGTVSDPYILKYD